MKKQFIIQTSIEVEFECMAEDSKSALEQFKAELADLKENTDFILDINERIDIHTEE